MGGLPEHELGEVAVQVLPADVAGVSSIDRVVSEPDLGVLPPGQRASAAGVVQVVITHRSNNRLGQIDASARSRSIRRRYFLATSSGSGSSSSIRRIATPTPCGVMSASLEVTAGEIALASPKERRVVREDASV